MDWQTRTSECWVDNHTAVYTVYHWDCGDKPGWKASFVDADKSTELGTHPTEMSAKLACTAHEIFRISKRSTSVRWTSKGLRRAG